MWRALGGYSCCLLGAHKKRGGGVSFSFLDFDMLAFPPLLSGAPNLVASHVDDCRWCAICWTLRCCTRLFARRVERGESRAFDVPSHQIYQQTNSKAVILAARFVFFRWSNSTEFVGYQLDPRSRVPWRMSFVLAVSCAAGAVCVRSSFVDAAGRQ